MALAAEVYTDGFAVALVGLGATIVARHSRDLPVSADPEQALAPVSRGGYRLCCAQSGRPCVGAAVALPAAVAKQARDDRSAQLYFGWPDGAKMRDIFAAQLTEHGVIGPQRRATEPGAGGRFASTPGLPCGQ